MAVPVRFENAPAQPLAVVKRRAKQSELSRVVPEACGAAWKLSTEANLQSRGRMVALYLDCEMNLEIGLEVAAPFEPFGELHPSQTPAGPVATATHIGPYHLMGEAHRSITDAVKAQGRTLAGPSWEIYGHPTPDPAQTRVDIYYLLKE